MNENELVVQAEPQNVIKRFFQDTILCLTEPRKFFTARYPEFTLTRALVFALILNWIASLLEWLTRMVKHETLLDGLNQMRAQLESLPFWKDTIPHILGETSQQTMMPAWIMELGSVALNPFKTLIGLVFTAAAVWVGGLLLIPKTDDRDPVEFSSFLKVIAVATSAPKIVGAILGFLPLGLGAFIGYIYILAIEVFALSIRFRISILRSIAVKYLPSIIFMLIISMVIAVFAVLIMGIVASIAH